MGMRLCLAFENNALAEVSSTAMARSTVMGKLDEIARAQDVILLENYCSPTVGEILRSIVNHETPSILRWFDAEDGAATVRALLEYVRAHPRSVPGVLKELTAFDASLQQARSRRVRFRLWLDYGNL